MRHGTRYIEEKIIKLNDELVTFCEENLVIFLCNKNIDMSCLGQGKFHPDKKGKAYLAKKFISVINDVN